jgi:hypothetical protein
LISLNFKKKNFVGWGGDLAGVELDPDEGGRLSFEYILGKIFIPLVFALHFCMYSLVSRAVLST